MNQGNLKPTDIIPQRCNTLEADTKDEFVRRPGKFHRPVMGMTAKGNESFRAQTSEPPMRKPFRAHKVGINNGDVVLRTEEESRVILVPEDELIVYKRTGQPTGLTVFLTVVIIALGAFIVYILT